MASVKYLGGRITSGCDLFLPPLDSLLKLGKKNIPVSLSHTSTHAHTRARARAHTHVNHKTQPGHIYTLMHLLTLVKAKKQNKTEKPRGPVTPSLPLGHSPALSLQPRASSRRADAAESPGHDTKVQLSAAMASCGEHGPRKRSESPRWREGGADMSSHLAFQREFPHGWM